MKVSAATVTSALANIMINHSYIPKKIMSDLGTQFVSELLHDFTRLLKIEISHASLKHLQTIGVVERSHKALARILKLNSNEALTNWHKYVPLATFVHNTSYHTSIGCLPTVLFHGKEPMKPLDLKFYTIVLRNGHSTLTFLNRLGMNCLKKSRTRKKA